MPPPAVSDPGMFIPGMLSWLDPALGGAFSWAPARIPTARQTNAAIPNRNFRETRVIPSPPDSLSFCLGIQPETTLRNDTHRPTSRFPFPFRESPAVPPHPT